MRGLETDLVVTGVGGDEGELAGGFTALGDDAVVVVEDFIDEDEDFKGGVERVAVLLGVELLGFVVAWEVSAACKTIILFQGDIQSKRS